MSSDQPAPDTPSIVIAMLRRMLRPLVNSVSVDIHPRSVLDEWVRIGVAEIDGENLVELQADAFVPSRGFEEKAHFVGRNLRDHVSAAAENLGAEVSPHLERSVFGGSLPPEAVAERLAYAREVGQGALTRVNDRARELKHEARERGESQGASHRRSTFGVYQYDAPSEEVFNEA